MSKGGGGWAASPGSTCGMGDGPVRARIERGGGARAANRAAVDCGDRRAEGRGGDRKGKARVFGGRRRRAGVFEGRARGDSRLRPRWPAPPCGWPTGEPDTREKRGRGG
jgi:hypothetical protein